LFESSHQFSSRADAFTTISDSYNELEPNQEPSVEFFLVSSRGPIKWIKEPNLAEAVHITNKDNQGYFYNFIKKKSPNEFFMPPCFF
jgi:hypothetical protein